jgi:hypothetical protein
MKNKPLLKGILITLTSFALILLLFIAGLSLVNRKGADELTAALKTTVLRAALTCYAVEGRYPSDSGYLEAYYGLSYDHTRYIVSLDAFADNILPDISVLQIGVV